MPLTNRLAALVGLVTVLVCFPDTVLGDVKCFSVVKKSQFTNCQVIFHGVSLYWRVDTKRKTITFAVNMEREPGWFGLGISEGSAMQGADMAVVQKDVNTKMWYVGDYFSTEFSMPQRDKLQNVRLPGQPRTKADGSFYAVIERPLDSCDNEDLPVLYDTDIMVIFSFGDPGAQFGYHGPNRAHVLLRLWPSQATAAAPKDPSDLHNLTISTRKHIIPQQGTSYLCVNFELPSDHKYHAIRAAGLIGSPLVHHMILTVCPRGVDRFQHPPGVPYDCLDVASDCASVYLGWAPGSNVQVFPAVAGLPLGKTSYTHASLQIHYNNPEGLANQVDKGTGFVLQLTRRLRKFDIGVLTLGSESFSVPPGVKGYTIPPAVCPSNCTKLRLTRPVTLLENRFHMHMTGMQIVTRHFRGNKELQPLGYRRWFNFDYQSGHAVMPQSRKLLPGDTLVTTCTFDTSYRTATTSYGSSSQDEMCFNYLEYYPAVEGFDHCALWYDQPMLATCSTADKLTTAFNDEDYYAALQKLVDTGDMMVETQPFNPQPYLDLCGFQPDLADLNGSQPYLVP